MTQPNIIFIMADQLAASFVGCYGSGVDSTPNLDALASKGRRYDRFYAHCPVCAPNRASILTGRSIEVHGIVTNNLTLRTDHPTFPKVLQSVGYRTGGFGKFHLTPMHQPLPTNFEYLGFDESIPTEDPKLGPWLDWIRDSRPDWFETALAVSWPMPYLSQYGTENTDLRPTWEQARRKYLDPLKADSEWSNMYPSPLPPELHQTSWITDCGIDFMNRHLQEHQGKPFFCQISYVDPHAPYDPPKPYDTLFDPADMSDPIPPAVEKYPNPMLERVRDWAGFSAIAHDPVALRRLRALYHGSIRFIDDQIGRIMEFVDRSGIAEETVIIFTTDHGDMMGDHGFMAKGIKHYDSGIRCPLILKGTTLPDERTGQVDDRLCTSLDLFPTICNLAGTSVLPPIEGRSLLDVSPESRRSEIHIESPYNFEGHVDTVITDDRRRLSIFSDGTGQMFDLTRDPQEQEDLYRNVHYSDQKVELLERLAIARMGMGVPQQYPVLPKENGKRCTIPNDLRGPLEPTWTE